MRDTLEEGRLKELLEDLDPKAIKTAAEFELKQEKEREAIDLMKNKIKRQRNLWNIIFPFEIVIRRK